MPTSYVISGRVLDADGAPQVSKVVRVIERVSLTDDQIRGTATTSSTGAYSITINTASTVPLALIVTASETSGPEIARSRLLCRIPSRCTVDLVTGTEPYRGRTEWDRVVDALAPHLGSMPVHTIPVTHIEWLACRSNVFPMHVAAWLQAARLANGRSVPAKAFYALIRGGLSPALIPMLQAGRPTHDRLLTAAFDGRMIPRNVAFATTVAEVADILDDLDGLAVDAAVRTPSVGERSLRPLLDTTGYDETEQREFLSTWLANRGNTPALWAAIEASSTFGASGRAKLQFALQAAAMMRGHLPAVENLQTLLAGGTILSLAGVGAWTLAQWTSFTASVGAPDDLPGSTTAARRTFFAKVLRRIAEDAFPTPSFRAQLAAETTAPPDTEELVTFLTNNPDFDISKDVPATYLETNSGALTGITDPVRLRRNLQKQQRLHRIAGRFGKYAVAKVLGSEGISSAASVVAMGRDAFTQKFAPLLDGIEDEAGIDRATLIFETAQAKYGASLSLFTAFGAAFNQASPAAVGGPPASLGGGNGAADLQTLFGTHDRCSCRHCASVYSPAAYLADLLTWLNNRPAKAASTTALDVLLARRPDIARIQLSCENANTTLPYIDIVNELLEQEVSPEARPPWPQTTLAADELLVTPEHVNGSAYDELAAAVFPWSSPFDRWGHEARTYLAQVGVDRSEVLRAWQPATGYPETADIVADALGISRPQYNIIIASPTPDPDARELWGFDDSDDGWVASLSTAPGAVPRVLVRSGATLADLREVLQTEFVNPTGSIQLVIDDCDLESAELDNLFADDLQRWHRIGRLQLATGIGYRELSAVISGLGGGVLDATCLERLVDLRRIATRFDVPLLDALAWFSPIDTRNYEGDQFEPCLYDRLFRNPAIAFPLSSAFALDGTRTELSAPQSPNMTATATAMVIAALRVTEGELDAVVGLGSAFGVTNQLNLANLSTLWRHVSLARALELRIADLVTLRRITAANPFASPAEAIQFAEDVAAIRRSSFSIAELDYLSRHAFNEVETIAASDAVILDVFDDITAAVRAAHRDLPAGVPGDPDGAMTRQVLGTYIVVDTVLDQAMALLAMRSPLTSTPMGGEQATFIAEHFGAFCDVLDAQQKLVLGPGLLTTAAARFAYVLEQLLPAVRADRANAAVLSTLSMHLGVDADAALALSDMVRFTTSGPIVTHTAREWLLLPSFLDATSFNLATTHAGQAGAYRRLHKAALVVRGFGIATEDFAWYFAESPPKVTWLDLGDLPTTASGLGSVVYDQWRALLRQRELVASFQGRGNVHEAIVGSPSDTMATALDVLAENTGWDRGALGILADSEHFELAHPTSFHDEAALVRLRDAITTLRRLGVTATRAWDWFDSAPSRPIAEGIQKAVRAKSDGVTWKAVGRALRDKLRTTQRDALLRHLIHVEPDLAHPNDVYARLLVDTQTSDCALTSRLRLALSSVQLFIQRVLLNLEHSLVVFNDVSRREWDWMKNYRLWEANRKVLLYPENWIEPELRDDRSSLFKELQSSLQQGDLSTERISTAFEGYLRGLHRLSHLDVVGVFHEDSFLGQPEVIHVVARTRGEPAEFYYRKQINRAYWTSWEPIPLDIDSDKVAPVVHAGRLFLFWATPEQVRKSDGPANTTTKQRTQFHVRVSWSERGPSGWGPKRATGRSLGVTDVHSSWDKKPSSISLRAYAGGFKQFDKKDLYVEACYATENLAYIDGGGEIVGLRVFAFFRYNEVTGDLVEGVVGDWPGGRDFEDDDNAVFFDNAYLEQDIAKFPDTRMREQRLVTTKNGESVPIDFKIVDPATEVCDFERVLDSSSPHGTAITIPHHFRRFDGRHAMFMGDSRYVFYVEPLRHIEHSPVGFQDGAFAAPPQPGGTPWDQVWGKITPTTFTAPDSFEPSSDAPSPVVAERLDALSVPAPWGGGLPGAAGLAVANGDEADAEPEYTPVFLDFIVSSSQQTASASTSIASNESDTTVPWNGLRWRFWAFSHPYSSLLLREFARHGVDGVLAPRMGDLRRQALQDDFFEARYSPTEMAAQVFPIAEFDVTRGGAYSSYNYELFFHLPFYVARRLSQEGRYEEAQRWFHYVFNPLDSSEEQEPRRFWNFRPFYMRAAGANLDFLRLVVGFDGSAAAQEAARGELQKQIAAWRQDPFDPHLIAGMRPGTYERAIVMAYLDNLLAWGDALFRRDTIESLNEATQIYALAEAVLGDAPVEIDSEEPSPVTFADMFGLPDPPPMMAALVAIENFVPIVSEGNNELGPIFSVYFNPPVAEPPPLLIHQFCVPPNDKLLEYWRTVADRLFKIRNCLNLQGVRRQLALFDPPIDPALLVRAVAAGVDLASVLDEVGGAPPVYRYRVLHQRAVELCATVRSLGGQVMATLEKRDGEALALLRAEQDVRVQRGVRAIRQQQIEEAQANVDALRASLDTTKLREEYYRSRPYLNDGERRNIDQLGEAERHSARAQDLEASAQWFQRFPDMSIGWSGMGPSYSMSFGGSVFATFIRGKAAAANYRAGRHQYEATLAGNQGSYDRRADDWKFQAEQAKAEAEAILRQIVAAEVRVEVARAEQTQQERQIAAAEASETFMRSKYTTTQLYEWMLGQLSGLYFQAYRLAYDTAKKAERAYRFELGVEISDLIQFGHWDGLRKGLLAGERLEQDLHRLEAAYLDGHRRELELTKNVSLAAIAPDELVRLRETGICDIELPEVLFDLDYPGQFMRRIKSVSITIPAVAGPHVTVAAKLTLLSDKMRVGTGGGSYAESPVGGDGRFRYRWGAVDAIATSTANNDGGVFQLDFRDERYLPFEGAGAISRWQLRLPQLGGTPPLQAQFDFETISDVVLQVAYTARDAGETLASTVTDGLLEALSDADLKHCLSLRDDFPVEWAQLMNPPDEQTFHATAISVAKTLLPRLGQLRSITISQVELILVPEAGVAWSSTMPVGFAVDASPTASVSLAAGAYGNAPHGSSLGADPDIPVGFGTWNLRVNGTDINAAIAVSPAGPQPRIDPGKVRDLLFIVHYSIT